MRPGTTVRPCKLMTLPPPPGLAAFPTDRKRPFCMVTELTMSLRSFIVWMRPLTKVSPDSSSPLFAFALDDRNGNATAALAAAPILKKLRRENLLMVSPLADDVETSVVYGCTSLLRHIA